MSVPAIGAAQNIHLDMPTKSNKGLMNLEIPTVCDTRKRYLSRDLYSIDALAFSSSGSLITQDVPKASGARNIIESGKKQEDSVRNITIRAYFSGSYVPSIIYT